MHQPLERPSAEHHEVSQLGNPSLVKPHGSESTAVWQAADLVIGGNDDAGVAAFLEGLLRV